MDLCTPPCYTSLVSLNGWAKKHAQLMTSYSIPHFYVLFHKAPKTIFWYRFQVVQWYAHCLVAHLFYLEMIRYMAWPRQQGIFSLTSLHIFSVLGDKEDLSACMGCDPLPYHTSPTSLSYQAHAPACMGVLSRLFHISLASSDDRKHASA